MTELEATIISWGIPLSVTVCLQWCRVGFLPSEHSLIHGDGHLDSFQSTVLAGVPVDTLAVQLLEGL